MDRRRRGIRPGRIALTVLVLMVCYPVVATLAAGHTWRESDWNSDGRTTLGEWFSGMNVGRREVVVAGQACTEYFDYKAVNVVRLDCPAHG